MLLHGYAMRYHPALDEGNVIPDSDPGSIQKTWMPDQARHDRLPSGRMFLFYTGHNRR